MGKRGFFGPVRLLLLAVIMIFLWVIILPNAVTPGITTSIDAVQGSPNGEMAEMILRMIPWAFVIILVLGAIWLAATS